MAVRVFDGVPVDVCVAERVAVDVNVGVFAGVFVMVAVLVMVIVAVLVWVTVSVGATVDERVADGVRVGTQKIPVYTEFEKEGGGESSESMPAVFVIVCPHAPVTCPHHDTACTPPHVLPTVQLTTLPGLEHDVPPPQPR